MSHKLTTNYHVQSTSSTEEPTHQVAKTPGLTAQSKYIIENLWEFFEEEKRTTKSVLREEGFAHIS